MRRLELDAGNSRLKWRLRDDATVFSRGVIEAGSAADVAAIACAESVIRVDVASVRGARFEAALRDALHRTRGGAIRTAFAASGARFDGLESGYEDPARLGVDRWLALVAGWAETRAAFVCVDAGTALTVDVVTAAGRHCGGYILPGIGLMRASLFAGTEAVKVDAADTDSLVPGTRTDAAVNRGIVRAAVALVEAVRADLGGAQTPVLLAGGDAVVLAPHLDPPTHLRPELVLDGLALQMQDVRGGR